MDAAETCFVRNGFHRSTMQDLAREAEMSSPNIYRYFESKEAVVRGLAERDRERGTVLVAEMELAGDRRGALLRILGRYFTEITREAAILRIDLWSEATRNPDIAALVESGEAEALDPMSAFERKVVHDAVTEAGLHSESEGAEPRRCVVVLPG